LIGLPRKKGKRCGRPLKEVERGTKREQLGGKLTWKKGYSGRESSHKGKRVALGEGNGIGFRKGVEKPKIWTRGARDQSFVDMSGGKSLEPQGKLR